MESINNVNVGIYTRVSSEKQIEEGHSLEWQMHLLKEYAKNHSLNVIDTYIEEGISGDNINKRPQLKRLLEDVKTNKINGVLVYKIDRLGRDDLVNSIICKALINSECILISSDCGVMDLKTAFGSFIYNILSAISQYEVDTLSERIINGKKQRVRDGLYINSNNVYGYDAFCDYKGTRLLKINDFESQIVKEIFNSYMSGISMNNIAINLTERNIPCKRGGKWRQSTIYQILNNKLYIGIVSYNGNSKKEHFENKGIHIPIIDNNTFYKVQELIKSKHQKKVKKFPNEYSYFSMVLITRNDDYSFKPKQIKAQDKSSVRYYCKSKGCKIPSIKHIDLEKKFAMQLENINLHCSDKIIKRIFKNADYDIISKLINKVKKSQNELLELKHNDVIKNDLFEEKMKDLNTKQVELEKKQNELKAKIKVFNDNTKNEIYKIINRNLMANFMSLKRIDKKEFVSRFVDKIIIDELHNIKIIWKRQ